jgi:hypothetical protein
MIDSWTDGDTPAAWERQPGEGARPFAAFAVYRDQPPGDRSLRGVAEQVDKSLTLVGRWSAQWRWVERVGLWDAHQDRLRRVARARRQIAADERTLEAAEAIQDLVLRRLQALEPGDISPTVALRMWDAARRHQREVLGVNDPDLRFDGSPDRAEPADAALEPLLETVMRGNPSLVGPVITRLAEIQDLLKDHWPVAPAPVSARRRPSVGT